VVGVAPHVLGAVYEYKIRRLEVAAVTVLVDDEPPPRNAAVVHGFPNDVLDRLPAVGVADLPFQRAVAVEPHGMERPPRLRTVALPETGRVRAHVAGDAEVPWLRAGLETALRTG
jgi:hypothetical protein